MSEDAIFPEGLFVKDKHPSAPDFIKCKLSIKKEELIAWMQKQEGEWLNMDVKRSQGGKLYVQVDTWKPDNSGQQEPSESDGDSVPF